MAMTIVNSTVTGDNPSVAVTKWYDKIDFKDFGALVIVLVCLILIAFGVNSYVPSICTLAIGYYIRKRMEVKNGIEPIS